jgi:hypothetical protein
MAKFAAKSAWNKGALSVTRRNGVKIAEGLKQTPSCRRYKRTSFETKASNTSNATT